MRDALFCLEGIKMKHFFSLLVCTLFSFLCFTVFAADESIITNGESNSDEVEIIDSGKCDYGIRWSLDSTGTITFNGRQMYGFYSIDDTPWYQYKHLIKKAVFADGMINIGQYTFQHCNNLENVVIPNSVEKIHPNAFENCDNLSQVVFSKNLIKIGCKAFYDCNCLVTVTLNDNIEEIDSMAFARCRQLDRVNISNLSSWCNIDFADEFSNPLYFSGNLYLNDVLLEEVYIPDDISTIKSYCFSNSNVKKVYFHAGLKKIEEDAFYLCGNIEEVYFEGSLDEWNGVDIRPGNDSLSNAELFVNYIPQSNKIFFEQNTHENVSNMPEIHFALGTFVFPETEPQRAGYTFLGWSEEKEGSVKFVSGQITEIYEEKTFYAIWEKKVSILDNPLTIVSTSTTALKNSDIEININLKNSNGFSNLGFDVNYDSEMLELKDVQLGFAYDLCEIDTSVDGVVSFSYLNDENLKGNGVLASITFALKSDSISSSKIDVVPDEENCMGYNEDNEKIQLNVEDGDGNISVISERKFIPGDVNGDGKISIRDASAIFRYLAGYDVVLN